MRDSTTQVGRVFSKVPEVTLFFWIIKVLCTTVGETAADFLNVRLNLGLAITSVVMGILFLAALFAQFKAKTYKPIVYWTTVVLISVLGTLVTDNLSDNLHVPLEYSTVLFAALLAITFGIWYAKEKTLSIHSIFTPRREAFYWLAILFTFALGTACGDLMAEALGLGYLTTGIIFAVGIAAFAIGWRMGLNAIIAFWFIYIMTRPLGASIGDFLSQAHEHGGLGLGPTTTTLIMTAGILLTVGYLTLSRQDVVRDPEAEAREDAGRSQGALVQLASVVTLLFALSIGGYVWRHEQLQTTAAPGDAPRQGTTTVTQTTPLGDVSVFARLAQDIAAAVNAGDWTTAKGKVNDLEYAWDNAAARLRPMNATAWTHVDEALDQVFRDVRAMHPNQLTTAAALGTLLAALRNP